MSSYKPKSKHQEHITPDKIYDMIYEFSGVSKSQLYDPCPAGIPYKAPCFFNGLYGDWQKWNYVNPMYEVKTLTKFVIKAIEQSKKGNKSWMLLPSKTDQEWFHKYIKHKHITWIEKRLKFKNNTNHATDPHFLVLIN